MKPYENPLSKISSLKAEIAVLQAEINDLKAEARTRDSVYLDTPGDRIRDCLNDNPNNRPTIDGEQ